MSGYETARAVEAQAAGVEWWLPLFALMAIGAVLALVFGAASGMFRRSRRTPPAARTPLPAQQEWREDSPYDWAFDPDYGIDWDRLEREVGGR